VTAEEISAVTTAEDFNALITRTLESR